MIRITISNVIHFKQYLGYIESNRDINGHIVFSVCSGVPKSRIGVIGRPCWSVSPPTTVPLLIAASEVAFFSSSSSSFLFLASLNLAKRLADNDNGVALAVDLPVFFDGGVTVVESSSCSALKFLLIRPYSALSIGQTPLSSQKSIKRVSSSLNL